MPDSLILTLVTGETSLSRWRTAEPSWSDSEVASPLVVYERSEFVAGSLLPREASETATAGR